MQAIAEFAGVHHSTVSRLIKDYDNNPRFKGWPLSRFHGGLRIYYSICDGKIVLLLCGGDKSSQKSDIDKAKLLLLKWRKT